MPAKKYLTYGLFLLAAIALLGSILFVARQTPFSREGTTHDVQLTEAGFSPQTITVAQGDTVIFTTTRDRPFWPASNLHPTHEIYAEFDPREPIAPEKSWSFRFDKPGQWKYHDHLSPLDRGLVTVLEQGAAVDGAKAFKECKDPNQNQLQCWEDLIDRVLEQEGLDAAFSALASLYATEPSFASECHGFVHTLGEAAYEKFAKHEDFSLTPKTSYCGYGFYHGFMETLLQKTGDLDQAREFCAYADAKLVPQVVGASNACYHGIGHGTVDGGDPRAWGDAKAMIAPGITMCELAAETEFQRWLCATGVFNAIEVLARDPKYQLEQLQRDPFSLCDIQPSHYRQACYSNMLPALIGRLKNDFFEIAKVVENTIENDDTYSIRSTVIMDLFHERSRVDLATNDHTESVQVCRSLDERSRLPCIEGLAGGHMKYGEPEKEYVKGLAFCNSDVLFENEKEVCFQHLLSRLRIWYSQEKSEEICNMADVKYRKFCN